MNCKPLKFGNGIGSEIKQIRRQMNAEKNVIADKAKLDHIHYDKIERNKVDIRLKTLIKIAEALGKPILMFEKYVKE